MTTLKKILIIGHNGTRNKNQNIIHIRRSSRHK